MKLFSFTDFFYVIEHNNEYFEFEFENDFLNNISEDLDTETFEILKISEISEGTFEILVKTPSDKKKVYNYTLSPERISYILSVSK